MHNTVHVKSTFGYPIIKKKKKWVSGSKIPENGIALVLDGSAESGVL